MVVATLGSKEGLANLAAAITSHRRHHPGAEPVLPDPPVWLHHRRGVRAVDPGAAG